MDYCCQHSTRLGGEVTIPGDKSQSHRAIMLASLAEGVTEIAGFLEAEDTLATLQVMRQLGVRIEQESSTVTVHGVGLRGLRASNQPLDLGNAGTGMRLLVGLLSWQSFASHLVGDESLTARPMRRIALPLQQMGAQIALSEAGTAPIQILPSKLQGLRYEMPVASGQIKSAILLAGLGAAGPVTVVDPGISRDHTERLMQYLGLPIVVDGNNVTLVPSSSFVAKPLEIVGDISSAAFFLVAATIIPGSDVLLKRVGINPTRTGVIDLLRRMGADITQLNQRESLGGEPMADLRIRSAQLHGIDIMAEDVPRAIDELPVVLVAAACAQGKTRLRAAAELRVKESDRLAATAAGLQAMGIEVDEYPDGVCVQGGRLRSAIVDSHGDHRIAMAFAVAAACAEGESTIQNTQNVATSFPDFVALARVIGMQIEERYD